MGYAGDYVTADEFKHYQQIADDVDDLEVALAITAASRAVDDHCGRQFGQVDAPETREYRTWIDPESGAYVANIDDLQDTTGLVVEVDGTAAAGWTLEPVNAPSTGRPYTRLVLAGYGSVVRVTGLWGWVAVPAQVKQATLLQASRFFARRMSPHGIAGSPELGTELRFLARLDPDVAVSLRGLVRPRGFQ